MQRPPWTVWVGLAVVLAAAAVLSFDTLRSLALDISIPEQLSPLLPVSIDAGASVSCAIWLGGRTPTDAARFAGRMTWALLAVTVIGNAGRLGMHANHIPPPWWVAVAVGSIPPAVVGATVHLIVLLVRRPTAAQVAPDGDKQDVWTVADEIARIRAGGGSGDAEADEAELRRLEYLLRRDLPDRVSAVDTTKLTAVIDDLRAGAGRAPGGRFSRDDIAAMYRIGKGRVKDAMVALSWDLRAVAGDPQAEASA